ncbi:phage terminase large subunit family protein [Aliarcobacter butzleri]|uniref:phage terminase large subunit family protein n=1 Tax=Aliarcobacter butzleri TaxID=28197 RepID=UPI001EDC7A13|nr:terminase gpA endonuclease subunit [Aliarcobacter butzleri]MCG3671969.1 phage terminase large subunit family protein [Aliarcobacter butzleri]MCG3680266.1 phage terminase large subunit family protein [Aliarcobacter butzleri]
MSANTFINHELLRYFKKGFEPDPLMTVSEWADNFRVLPSESSSQPGQYRTETMPYLEEIAYELSPQSPTDEVSVIKGTQLGFTELGNNMLFCYADLYPCPMLQILPTETAVKTHALSKLWPSIEASPRLKNTFKKRKTQDGSSIYSLMFKGGNIALGWSNSPATFASSSRRIVINDDVDKWPDEIEGGNPLDLSKNRAETYSNKKIYNNASPAKKHNSKILPKYETSSQGLYTMKCPHCGEDVVFEKDGFKFNYDENYQLIDDVVFVCSNNGCIIEEHQKYEMMKKENGARYVHKFPERKHKGYRVPSYYSPFAKWNEIFQSFLDARKEQKEKKISTKMASWTNTKDANVWEEKIEKLDVNEYLNRHEEYAAEVPNGVFILTAGVDTQDDRLEVEVVGWGKYGESWSIAKLILEGDPKFPRVWQKLDNVLENSYKHESGIDMKILGMGIDSGGHRTDYVYNYCKTRVEQNVFCMKGDNSVETPILKSGISKNKDGSLRLYMIGVNSAKDVVYGQLTTKEVGPGYMHYPKKPEYNEEHFKQLTGEAKDKTTGRWKKFRTRNEALDLRVYAMATLRILENQYYPNGMDWDDIELEFNARVEEELNTVKKVEKEVVEHNSFSDWRDNY